MCWFKRNTIRKYPLDIERRDTDPFNRKIVEEINELREHKLLLVHNKLISFLAESHCRYLLNHPNHDNDGIRRQLIKDNTKYNRIGENVGYGYTHPSSLVHAWYMSKLGHKEVMLGDYTHLVIGKYGNFVTGLFLKTKKIGDET